ncbi:MULTISPECIES: DUF488 family protein [unclassified Sphingopyxis]|uniref:DUF488 domain-containing protein n=1 Tax=unclassified Sphingopyxis TaxID=2614943 RepID=UPI0007302184|nr:MULTISPECIES: DUF488 family protein [unclassified Sphingopyxis]KTE28072.1 hypothetical protein ATE61_01775 [Sphingopyxis sp. H057]KTE55548.1 hypothetical protein ATE64_01140 [Sphingopyxis sp. H073]KTE57568.1 hypothetical protein ATE69_01775 [Sphingopyxis sp. H071]KTE57985.1 hypothetical protein ATE66_17025 [Sphingopyxis sp. H107]KTE66435.1 hypothetical protein ATE65_05840 [Sphingopyxis sp. H100]
MKQPVTIAVKRIHDAVEAGDGARFLVDRLWPRGVSKEKAALSAWLKPLSPSDGLRKRYHGETADSDEAWDAFRLDYFAELDAGGEEVRAALFTLDAAADSGPVTLLYAAKSAERNNALALREWLERR